MDSSLLCDGIWCKANVWEAEISSNLSSSPLCPDGEQVSDGSWQLMIFCWVDYTLYTGLGEQDQIVIEDLATLSVIAE